MYLICIPEKDSNKFIILNHLPEQAIRHILYTVGVPLGHQPAEHCLLVHQVTSVQVGDTVLIVHQQRRLVRVQLLDNPLIFYLCNKNLYNWIKCYLLQH